MIRLKNKYRGRSAINIMGGPSILEKRLDLSQINKDIYTVFLESKALTPKFLEFGIRPDFFLIFFSEKCQSNSFQHAVYQSFLIDFDLSRLLKNEYLKEYLYFKENFEEYFEPWSPKKGLFKKYRWKRNIKLPNSPFDLLHKFPETSFIAHARTKEADVNLLSEFQNNLFVYDDKYTDGEFCLERYYNPVEIDNRLVLNTFNHLNSAAIALFSLQAYMGFEKIYFIGMDMSMLGSMEYSALYTFKSLKEYEKFFKKATAVFNPCFKRNKNKFMRPPYEFDDMKEVLGYNKIEFVNVYEPFEFAMPLEGIRNITFKEFLNE